MEPTFLIVAIAAISLLFVKSIANLMPTRKSDNQISGILNFISPRFIRFFRVAGRPPPPRLRNDSLDLINRFGKNVSQDLADLFETLLKIQNIDGRPPDGPRSRSLAYLCPQSFTDDGDGRRQAKEAFQRDCKDYLDLDDVPVWTCSIVPSRHPGRTRVEVLVSTATADLILCRKPRLPAGTTISPWLPATQRRREFNHRRRQRRTPHQHGNATPTAPSSQHPTSQPSVEPQAPPPPAPPGPSSSTEPYATYTFNPRVNRLKRTVMLPMNLRPALAVGESCYIGAKFVGGTIVEVRKRFGKVQGLGKFIPVTNETDPRNMVDLVRRLKKSGDDS